MVKKWSKTLNEGGEIWNVWTDLTKAFDCIDHNLLIPKLGENGFEKQSIDSFTKWKQRTKVESDSVVSSWEMLFSADSRFRFRTIFIIEGAKNFSWPWLSPLRGWDSLTMAFNGKFVYMAHHFIMLRLNPFGLRVDREGWWFEHSLS